MRTHDTAAYGIADIPLGIFLFAELISSPANAQPEIHPLVGDTDPPRVVHTPSPASRSRG
jgi:hypothetical protein